MKLIDAKRFERNIDGYEVRLYTLRNELGFTAQITNFGARLVSLFAPDREGNFEDVVLGYDHLDAYLNDSYRMGATIGRYANRIANARFSLYGTEYRLTANDGPHHLHGGQGLQSKFWFVNEFTDNEIEMHCSSFDKDDGYPGRISVTMIYRLREDNALHILFTAVTDKPTILNLTNHSYFNLNGSGKGNILKHRLQLNAHYFTPVDETLIPTGEVISVDQTPFDFRKPAPIGERLSAQHEQLRKAGGFDHNFVVVNGQRRVKFVGMVEAPETGRKMEVFGSQPGVQFYSGNHLKNVTGKFGRIYNRHDGFCLETQHFPDSPHHPHFPLSVLMPDQVYRHEIIYKFSTEN